MSEVYNGVLKGVRSLPITAIVEESWNRTVGYFINRAMMAKKHMDEGKQFLEVAQAYMDKKIQKSRSHTVRTMDGIRKKFEIRLRRSMSRVKLGVIANKSARSMGKRRARAISRSFFTSPAPMYTRRAQRGGSLRRNTSLSSTTFTTCTSLGVPSSILTG